MATPFGPRRPSWLEQHEVHCFSQASNNHAEWQSPPAVNMFANAVYYANWSIYKQSAPSSLNISAISHIFYAFAWVKDDGTVYVKSNPRVH
jgi:GH18 family chitinase